MMRSNFPKSKRLFFLFGAVVIIGALITVILIMTGPESDTSAGKVTPESTLISVSTSSPIPPLSPPVSIIPSPETLDPDMTQQRIDEGIRLYDNGQYKEAIEIFNGLLAQNPVDVVSHNVRGSAYTALGDYQKAIDDFSEAIEIDPGFPHAYYNRGRAYNFLERYDEALSDFEKSIELHPLDFGYRANGNIGLIHHQLGDYDKALEAFNASVSYNQEEKADIYYYRGETYTALKNYEAAIADYQAALARFAQYSEAFEGLGYAYYQTGQLDQALEALNQALEISPNRSIANFYLALVYLATNQVDQAKAATSQAMDSIGALAEEEQKFIFTRVLADLKTFAQENPDRAKEVEALINLIPEP